MELTDYLRFVFALAFVIAVIFLLAFIARRYGMGYRNMPRGLTRRLSISEIIPVDTKRRLVLVRRDETEHLILIGGESDLLVEKNIVTGDKSFNDHLDMPSPQPELTEDNDRSSNS